MRQLHQKKWIADYPLHIPNTFTAKYAVSRILTISHAIVLR